LAAFLSWALTETSLGAIQFRLESQSISVNSGPDGLAIETESVLAPTEFTLNVGQSFTLPVFEIWTDETTVNADDLVSSPISVAFSFSEPEPAFGAGDPHGGLTQGVIGRLLVFLPVHYGSVSWGSPTTIPFGPNQDGELQVQLSNETFNSGLFGLKDGSGFGATVDATFTLVKAASTGSSGTGPPGHTPEPAALVVWAGLGLCAMAVAARRRRSASATLP
jgi:hypothetical protein